jgi:hypothetical protein
MVETRNAPWWPLSFFLQYLSKMLLHPVTREAAVKSHPTFHNVLLTPPVPRKVRLTLSFYIALFSEFCRRSRRCVNPATHFLLRKWQYAMLFFFSDFLIFGK